MKIKIKYFNNARELKMNDKGNWCDLYANEDVFVPVNKYRLVHLGIAMELPKGYEAYIVPRSSTFKTWGIIQINHIGIVDNSYCGDNDQWKLAVYCLDPKDFINNEYGTLIKKGDKIAQFRIMEIQSCLEFEKVNKLNNKDRNGFGSTGR